MEVACQAVVEAGVLKDELKGGVIGPFEAEETGHEVFCRFEHTVLGGGPGDDLGAGVVEVAVIVVVKDTGVEQSVGC